MRLINNSKHLISGGWVLRMKMLEDSFSGEARFPADSTFSLCSLISQASSLLSGVSLIGVPISFIKVLPS